ncbi:snf7 family protein [Moesziomyces antarcticus]|uniref:Snf7 family protein n=2 Tax=Pseudozyma antarctica TaxID=84753 RepID=A0A081CIZ3_PSEA2|nr:snf7 family protein [Moesziomyces antarcticus]GAK66639.1 snf7 family protein [Moesziomyces antarcticus]SPO47689.1 related to VPS20 - myristoylated subunit of the endosomal sorting complex [Moesziomyces antarcticus]
MGATSSKGPKITPHDRAVLDLKLQRDRIKQYQKKCLAKGDKAKALTALRRRKYQESLIQKTDSQLETLEGLVSSIEFSQIQQSVMLGLQQGNAVLKQIHTEMNPESVERLLEETAEAQAYQREIDEMLATNMTAEEEDAVQSELEQLEREAGVRVDVPSVELPEAPTTEPVAQTPVQEQQPQPQPQKAQPERQAVLA